MIARALAWARVHRMALAIVVAVLVATHGAAFYAGRRSVAQPAVKLEQDAAQKSDAQTTSQTTDEKGPRTITVDEVDEYNPAPTVTGPVCPKLQLVAVPMPGPVRTLRHTVIEEGPQVVTTRVVSRLQEDAQQHVSLAVTPAAAPRWAVGAGLEDPLGARAVQVTAGMRLLGPIWLRAAFTPARGLPGASVGAEVTF